MNKQAVVVTAVEGMSWAESNKLKRLPGEAHLDIHEVWSMDFVSDRLSTGRRIKGIQPAKQEAATQEWLVRRTAAGQPLLKVVLPAVPDKAFMKINPIEMYDFPARQARLNLKQGGR